MVGIIIASYLNNGIKGVSKMKLDGKVVVVTGASSGMGREIALTFAKEGAKVVAVARRVERLAELEEKAKELPGEIVACAGDLSKEEAAYSMIDFAVNKYGKVDILVNNAGVLDDFSPAHECKNEIIEKVVAVDMLAPLYSTRYIVNYWLEKEMKGNIINVASIAGIRGAKSGVAYCMAKHAVVGLTENTAFMYRQKGIRCNAICPGGINTEMTDPSTFASCSQWGLGVAMISGALGIPSGEVADIANAALFLADDASSYVTGLSLVVDGGVITF